MITKGDIVNQAFEYLRISGLTNEAAPRDTQLALRSLDSIMLAWTNKGLNLSWNKSDDFTDPDPQEDSGISDADYEAIYVNLAVKLAPAFGKPPTQLDSFARELYAGLFSTELPTQQNNTYMPLGSGNRHGVCAPVFQQANEPIDVENDGNITI